jgi:hypothetical protein
MPHHSLIDIVKELNWRARSHPIGTLQVLRGHSEDTDLFRLNGYTTRDDWACHWGGRTELQFNIGYNSQTKHLRHGVAFSFQSSREYQPKELVHLLTPKINAFNRFVRRNPDVFKSMEMWAWDGRKDEIVYEAPCRNYSKIGGPPSHVYFYRQIQTS